MRARTSGLAAAAALAAGLPTLLAGLLGSTAAQLTLGPDDSMVRTHTVPAPAAGPDDAALGLLGAHPATGTTLQVVDGPAQGEGDGSRGVPIRVSGTALPARVLLAYRNAANALGRSDPACHVSWSLLAGIGQVESGHAYNGAVDRQGRTLNPILGPELNGVGDVAAIPDTDGGRWDGDTTWDRAVGPMQFIPSSWQVWGRDGDGDGKADPSDVDDAAMATASYLCAGDRDLRDEKDRRSAVFSYNHSWDYVDLVLAWADAYATGVPLTTDLLPAADGGRGRPSGGERPGEGAVLALPAPGATQEPATAGSGSGAGSAAPPSAAPAEGPQPTDATTSTAAATPTSTTTVAPSDPPTEPDPCATPSPTDTPTGDPTDTATPSPTPTESVTPDPNPTDSSPSPTTTACPTAPPAGS
ncbi:MAG: hypothetical protein QOD68_2828 [Actinomycetota bacterium]|jgi:hypothetical protein|nr:hypothetical protein [Actinomycetota bacterium]